VGLCPARRRVWFAGVGDPSGEADGLAVAVTGIALRILIFFGVADGEGWGVGLLPTNMRWKSDAFLGFGVGETEAEGDAFARITLGLGVPAGDADASGDAEGVGLAWTIGRCLGFGDGVGVGVPVDSVCGEAPADCTGALNAVPWHRAIAMSASRNAKSFLIMSSAGSNVQLVV